MSSNDHHELDRRLANALADLRQRVRRYALWEAVLFGLLIVLATFFVGWLIDFVPTRWGGLEMPRSARAGLLVGAGLAIAYGGWRYWLKRRLRPLPDDSLALLIERTHPQFGGRFITAVQLLGHPVDAAAESRELLSAVHQEAAALADQIEPQRVFRWQPLIAKAAVAAPLLLGLLLLVGLRPAWAAQAWSRLLLLSDEPWPRRARLEVEGLEIQSPTLGQEADSGPETQLKPFRQGQVVVARGQAATLRIQAFDEPFVLPEVCTLRYRGADGQRGEANLRRVGRVKDGAQTFVLEGPPLDSIQSKIELNVRGLDARLDGLQIEVVEPPVIERLEIIQQLPGYLVEADDRQRIAEYRPGLRIPEGSDLILRGTTNRSIAEVRAWLRLGEAEGELIEAKTIDGGQSFELALGTVREPLTIELLPVDAEGISALAASRYSLAVLPDELPKIELQLQGIGTAVTPVAKLPLKGTAADDYGLQETAIVLVPNAAQADDSVRLPLAVDDRNEIGTVVDLKQLATDRQIAVPQPGSQIAVLGEARDGFDLAAPHIARTPTLQRDVVTEDVLLGMLQKNELILRGRLEQVIAELKQLRESLRPPGNAAVPRVRDLLASFQPPTDTATPDATAAPNESQLARLRVQQATLQADKSGAEVDSLVVAIDQLVAEMQNNRLDTVDRMNRLNGQVREPLSRVAVGDLRELRAVLAGAVLEAGAPPQAQIDQAERLVESALIQLEAVLANMLDMEDYNEVLELVRSLIEDQQRLIESTKEKQKQGVLELFE